MRSICKNAFMACLFLLSASSMAETAVTAAPDFTLKSTQGETLRLEQFRGQVVMLNFWASWCGPCRQEMPLLDDLYKAYQSLGFTLLAVNVDEQSSEADRFLKQVPVSFPVVYDNEGQVSQLYRVEAMPTSIIIDRDGNQRFIHLGYQQGYENDYRDQIKQLIRE